MKIAKLFVFVALLGLALFLTLNTTYARSGHDFGSHQPSTVHSPSQGNSSSFYQSNPGTVTKPSPGRGPTTQLKRLCVEDWDNCYAACGGDSPFCIHSCGLRSSGKHCR